MSPEDFRASCLILWGPEWRRPAREFLGVSDRNLSRFASGDKIVGPDFERELLNAIRVRHADRPTPIMTVLLRALEPANA